VSGPINKIQIAVIGVGRWGCHLAKTFASLGVLAAIVETNAVLGQPLARQLAVKYYSDNEQVLNSAIDAVAIATPAFTHFAIAKQALLAGKDVFVEKPMTATKEEADELINVARQKKQILMVGHLLLYQPAIKFIKEFITSGQLGKLHSLQQVRRSLGTIRSHENVLYSLGVHDLAVLSYLITEPVQKINAVAQAIITSMIADEMSIHFCYPSGIQAHLHLNWLWPIKERQLMILGEKGALHFDELQQSVTHYRHYGNKDASITKAGHEIIFADSRPPLTLELQHFIECIEKRQKPRSSGQQGREVVALMEAIMQQV
jgi:predicted dehydrogenase